MSWRIVFLVLSSCGCGAAALATPPLLQSTRGISVRRRTLLGAGLLALPLQPADAAIPSFSEYDAVQYRPKVPAASAPATSTPPLDTKEAWAKLSAALEQADSLLASSAFEDLRLLLRTSIIREFLGYQPGLRSMPANEMRPPAALLAVFPPDSRAQAAAELADVLLDIKALDDFCFENRVIFFTQEDKEAVGKLIEKNQQTVKVDLEEPRGILNDARQRLRLVIALYYGPECVACNGEAKSVTQR